MNTTILAILGKTRLRLSCLNYFYSKVRERGKVQVEIQTGLTMPELFNSYGERLFDKAMHSSLIPTTESAFNSDSV